MGLQIQPIHAAADVGLQIQLTQAVDATGVAVDADATDADATDADAIAVDAMVTIHMHMMK